MPAMLGRRRGRIVQHGWASPEYPVKTAVPADRTLHAFNPPAGFSPIVTNGPIRFGGDNTAPSQTSAIQAMLDFVSHEWGGGIVDLSANGEQVYCGGTTGLSIPAGVQLRGNLATKLWFPDLTTGSALTVNDNDFQPLADVWIEGPNTNVDAYPSGNASVGVDVTGTGLKFANLKVKYFGAGIALAHSETYIHDYDFVSVGNCGVCVYADQDGQSLTDFGERITFSNFTFANSALGVWATGNGLDLHLIGGSIDFCSTFGLVSNAWLYVTSCHLESGGITSPAYIFDVQNNSHVQMANTNVIMGGRGFLFNPAQGPSNYGYGVALFSNVNVYYTDSNDNNATHFSTYTVSWPSGTTTLTIPVPWPLRWCTIAADFVATDGYSVPNTDMPIVSTSTPATASVTITAPSNANQRWVRLVFG